MTRQYQSHVSNSMQTCFESILYNNIPLNHDHVPRRLPCGVEGWDCWNIVGVSQISDIFCTKLSQGVPDVNCVPSAHSMSWSFLGLSPTFCHLTSSLPLFVLCLFLIPVSSFGTLMEEVLSMPCLSLLSSKFTGKSAKAKRKFQIYSRIEKVNYYKPRKESLKSYQRKWDF